MKTQLFPGPHFKQFLKSAYAAGQGQKSVGAFGHHALRDAFARRREYRMNDRAIFPVLTLLMLCALTLVNAQYQARRLFIELERAQVRQRELEITWNQLQLEQSQLAKHARIDALAKNALGMLVPGSNRTQYLTAGAR